MRLSPVAKVCIVAENVSNGPAPHAVFPFSHSPIPTLHSLV